MKKIIQSKVFKIVTHKFIVWYLFKCGGAFHNRPYGDKGLYVALMSDEKYNKYQKL